MGVSIIGVRRHMHQMYQGLMSITMSVYTYTILNRMWEKLQLSLLCISGPDPPSQSGQASLGCDNFCNSNKKKIADLSPPGGLGVRQTWVCILDGML